MQKLFVCRILTHFLKCPNPVFFKLVQYTVRISNDPLFKEGYALFPILPFLPLSDKQLEKYQRFLEA